jgi:hypothetical protein
MSKFFLYELASISFPYDQLVRVYGWQVEIIVVHYFDRWWR